MTDPTPADGPDRRTFLAAAGAGLLSTQVSLAMPDKDAPPLAPPDKQPPNLHVPEPPKKTVGWAVVGLGELALGEIMPAFAQCRVSKPVALVSGHPAKAKRVAEAYGIDPKGVYDYGNYDTLADNKDVDVIYIVLPNSMHAEYTVRGLKAGKHVLCEKPMAVTPAECRTMIDAGKAAKKKLMIAYRLRYEPFNRTAIDLCRKGELGTIKAFNASNGQDVKAPNIRLSAKLGGGPVGDVGIYCLNAARYLTGEEPVSVSAVAYQPKDDPRFREVPESVAFTMQFPSGAIASCDCSFGIAVTRRLQVEGTKAVLNMDPAFAYTGLKLKVEKDGKKCDYDLGGVNHFAAEMEHFSECVLADKQPLTPGEEGLADMVVIAAIEEAYKSGKTVPVRR